MTKDQLINSLNLWESLEKFSGSKLWNEYIAHGEESVKRNDSLSNLPKNPSMLEGILYLQNILSKYARNNDKGKELFNELINQFKRKYIIWNACKIRLNECRI